MVIGRSLKPGTCEVVNTSSKVTTPLGVVLFFHEEKEKEEAHYE
jgi:hypothetical protein